MSDVANYKCNDCERYCDVMIDGFNEAAVGGGWCDKCCYGEWKEWEWKELKMDQALERDEVCTRCRNGCDWCLMVEPRSFI